MRVLLVGNGPASLAKEVGKQIDDFQGNICRFNNYTTKGYEKWVGTRTDIWISNNRHNHLINEFHKQRWFISPRFDEPTEKTIDFMRAQRIPVSVMEKTGYEMRYFHPSTGATATMFFLEQGYDVWIWGFDFLDTRRPHHYNNDNIVRGPDHDANAEWLFFNRLLDSGKIKYFSWERSREGIPSIRQPVPCGKDDDVSWYRTSAHEAWYDWIGRQNKGKKFLDIGAGLCSGMEILEKHGETHGYEVDSRLSGRHQNLTIGESLACYTSKSFDVVTAIDVIEHVVEDVPFMAELKRISRQKVYVTTPNFTRSRCGNIAHCREYSMAQFQNVFQPDQIWSGSPDGKVHITHVLQKKGEWIIDLSHEGPDNSRKPITYHAYRGNVPLDTRFNHTVDGEEWAHIAAVFNV